LEIEDAWRNERNGKGYLLVREERLELPRPLGYRILRSLQLRTDPGSTCRSKSSGVVLCPRVSSCCEQAVSRL
jgi:hypothetical protein